jgi:hypothetical protein
MWITNNRLVDFTAPNDCYSCAGKTNKNNNDPDP